MNSPQPEERGDSAEGPALATEGQDVLAVEGAILHPDLELPAVLQEGDVAHHGDGRIHIQAQALGGENGAECEDDTTLAFVHAMQANIKTVYVALFGCLIRRAISEFHVS